MEKGWHSSQLVFDIGAHAGDDTAVYLQLGYQVVSIEANPVLIEKLQHRFSQEIYKGHLTVVHAAVTQNEVDQVGLFVHDDTTKSSLFEGEMHQKINVPSRTLASLIKEYGRPVFCKIDIEGADLPALKSLARSECPDFISVELTHKKLNELHPDSEHLFATLNQLTALGYSCFKLVDQERLQILHRRSFYKKQVELLHRLKQKLLIMSGLNSKSRFLRRFHLEPEAEVSGLPTFLLKDRWYSADEMRSLIRFHFEEYSAITDQPDFTLWVDLHAAYTR